MTPEDPTPPRHRARLIALVALACLVTGSTIVLLTTETGRSFIDRGYIQSVGADVRAWVAENPVAAPALFIAAYVICAVLWVPVWPLQIMAGYGFGLGAGLMWCLTGSTTGSLVSAYFARWLGADWVRRRAGGKLARFHRLSELVGHNGLLVVLACRACYAVPYSMSNYLYGLTRIRAWQIIVGTVIGGIPVAAGYVAVGSRPGLLADWRFWAAVIGLNLMLVGPLAYLYYLRARRRRAVAGS